MIAPTASRGGLGQVKQKLRNWRSVDSGSKMRTFSADGIDSRLGRHVNIKKLQQGLKYRGRVVAVRQTYYVFEAKDYFFVLSFARSKARKGSGYFNVVDQEAVNYVHSRLGGRSGVTAKSVVSVARRTKHVPTSLTALNILYILVALGQAAILRAGEHRQLFFSVRKMRRPTRS
jgi:hypothetical protein